jgi:4-hydroxy-tetrahydrodipicolinate synthase
MKENKKKKYFGIAVPVITPVLDDKKLDEENFIKIIKHSIDSGADIIFPMGSSGEAATIDKEIWKRSIEVSINFVNGAVPVFCGVIDSSTSRVIEKIKIVEQLGAKTVVAIPPLYNIELQSEIVKHFEKICKSTNLEVVVYNNPDTYHVNILPKTLLEISKIENIVACKDSTSDWSMFQECIFMLENSKVSIFSGSESMFAASLLLGADGCVSVIANFFPKICVELYQAAAGKDIEKVIKLQKEVDEISKIFNIGKSWLAIIRYLATKMNLKSGNYKNIIDIIEPLNSKEKVFLDGIFNKYI